MKEKNIVTIISIFDKHDDFIKLQNESIVKFIKCDYEYIIFNNATNDLQRTANRNMCEELGIKCIDIHVNYGQDPSNIAGNALNESFKHLNNKIVFKIDSDMFFISNTNLLEFFDNGDLVYIPQITQDNREWMWSGIFGINLKNINTFIDFNPKVVINYDTFCSSVTLVENPKYSKNKFELFNIKTVKNKIYETAYNNDCEIKINESEILSISRSNYINIINSIKYNYIDKFIELRNLCEKYKFPIDYNIDIISMNNLNFAIHFKSSNWSCEVI